jgi:hypothetical protein
VRSRGGAGDCLQTCQPSKFKTNSLFLWRVIVKRLSILMLVFFTIWRGI